MYGCVLGNMYWVYRFHGPYVLEEYFFHMNMTLYGMCRFHRPYMFWGVPFSYEICTGCTVSIDPRLCVCILGVLPQDMETVEFVGTDLKCCYLTVEINTTFDIESCDLDVVSRSSYKVIITSSAWASSWYQFCVSTSRIKEDMLNKVV